MVRAVSRETLTAQYLVLLHQWGAKINLTSAGDGTSGQLARHLAVSLALAPEIPGAASRLIDLGSGQGFPAIPLAIETVLHIDLIEADRRKAAFLTTVLAKLQLPGTVWPVRIEQARVDPALCITARALAPLSTLLVWAQRLLQEGGCGLFLKGASVDREIADARASCVFDAKVMPVGNPPTCLVKVSGLR